MAKPRPPIDSVLHVIGGATPLLKELDATKANLTNYLKTVAEYQAMAQAEQVKISAIMERLQTFADEFVGLYTSIPDPVEEPPVEETPEEV